MPDISDAELNGLRSATLMLKSLYDNPDVGMDFRKIVKKAFPKTSIPELESVERQAADREAIKKEQEEFQKSLTKRMDEFMEGVSKEKVEKQVDAFADRVNKVCTENGLTAEGREKLLGIMKDRGIQNPEDAVIIFEKTQPKPAAKPRNFSSRMNFLLPEGDDDASFKKLMEDPEQYMMDEMMTALAPQEE